MHALLERRAEGYVFAVFGEYPHDARGGVQPLPHELEKIGIDTVAAFRRTIHAAQSLECHHRRKQLDAQRDGTKMRKCLLR